MDCYDDDDDNNNDDEDYGILKKALDVKLPKNFNPESVPQTGEEYLHKVIYERKQCQTVVTVPLDRFKFKDKQTFKINLDESIVVHKTILPSLEWQILKIEDFKKCRSFIETKINGESKISSSFNEAEFLIDMLETHPKFASISKYSQAAKIRMLQIINKYLDSIEKGFSIGENLGSWIYAILNLLEIPLSPSSCHTVREFAKRCLVLRSNLSVDADKNLYMPLNLFICIVARFYGQLDLADS